MTDKHDLPALYLARACAAHLVDSLDLLINDIQLVLDGSLPPKLTSFADLLVTDISLVAGAAVFHAAGAAHG